jgi:hypothetical protein
MPTGELIKRELRVAFSRRAQPVWFRIVKWALLLGLIAATWGRPHFWVWMAGAIAVGLTVHFIWRWKTKAWTQAWGGWNDVESANRR